MTYKEFINKSIERLSDIYSYNESKAISVRLLTDFLKISEYEYLVSPTTIIPKPDLSKLESSLDELADFRPIQYVLGYEWFCGHKFKVNESVLIPRPETEELCHLIQKEWGGSGFSEFKILDACTGSGCIAYSLAAFFSKSSVYAFDLYEDALDVARNQKIFIDTEGKQPLNNLPIFFKWDLLGGTPDEKDKSNPDNSLPDLEDIDILVSNPPYVCESEKDFMSSNVLDYEPDTALFVPDNDPLRFYRALAQWAMVFL